MRIYSFGQMHKLVFLDRLGNYTSSWLLRKEMKMISNKNQKHLMDLGCGYDAKISSRYFSLFKSTTLVDLAIREDLRKNDKVKVVEGDLNSCLSDFLNSKADIVLAINVLEHLDDPQMRINEMVNLLSNEARLIIQVPTWSGKKVLEFFAFRFGLIPRDEIEDHRTYFSKKELWILLRKSGILPSRIRIKRAKFGFVLWAIVKNHY